MDSLKVNGISSMASKGPLRKVIGYIEVEIAIVDTPDGKKSLKSIHEKLVCGHTMPIKHDIYGETYAYRRRCWKCLEVK
jgi:hypothetical protein